MSFKNDYYVSFLDDLTSEDILLVMMELLIAARENGVKVSIASASKNALRIIERLGISE